MVGKSRVATNRGQGHFADRLGWFTCRESRSSRDHHQSSLLLLISVSMPSIWPKHKYFMCRCCSNKQLETRRSYATEPTPLHHANRLAQAQTAIFLQRLEIVHSDLSFYYTEHVFLNLQSRHASIDCRPSRPSYSMPRLTACFVSPDLAFPPLFEDEIQPHEQSNSYDIVKDSKL